MAIDPLEQAKRFIRVYRVVKQVSYIQDERNKLKSAMNDHARQSDMLMDASDIIHRIRDKSVRPEDVRALGRGAMNSAPKLYDAISKYIRERKNA